MNRDRSGRTSSIVLLVLSSLLTVGVLYGYAQNALAQSSQRELGRAGSGGAFTFSDVTPTPSRDEVNQVSKELFCPLCTGVRVDNCDLPLCDQMREVIGQKLAAGESKEDIKAYFVEQYGTEVLGVPPKRGVLILAWVLPLLAVVAAGGWVIRLTRRRAGQRGGEEAEATAASQSLPAEYVARLERELEQFE